MKKKGSRDIRAVIADADGCLLYENKSRPPLEVDESPDFDRMREVRNFMDERREVAFGLCTNRSMAAGLRVAELVGANNAPSGYEGGGIVYDPVTGTSRLLVDIVDELSHLREPLNVLQKWKASLDTKSVEAGWGVPEGTLRFMSDRKTLFTYEILPYDNPPISGEELYEVLLDNYIPDQMKDLFGEGLLVANPTDSALDFSAGINKGHFTRYALGELGMDPAHALGVGDSSHSDIYLIEETRYAICPANAKNELKWYVRGMRENGYVSEKELGEGTLEGLRHFLG